MTLILKRFRTKVNSTASPTDRDAFRTEIIAACVANGVRGYFIIDETDVWIHLEGEEADIVEVERGISDSPVTTGGFDLETANPISNFMATDVFAYDQLRTPMTS